MASMKGLTIVFTGDGKGKTTAALGAALRSASRGMNTFCIQFLKTDGKSAEQQIPSVLHERIHIIPCGKGFVFKDTDIAPHKKAASEGWQLMRDELTKANYDILILDEVAAAINLDLLPLGDVSNFLRSGERPLHIILTGRNMPKLLIDIADTVTEMKEIKHAYNAGIPAARGIDY